MRLEKRWFALFLVAAFAASDGALAAPVGGSLDPTTVPQFVEPLFVPPSMPKTLENFKGSKNIDYYEIAVRQFQQQVLPASDTFGNPLGPTTVWGYGSVNHSGSFSYPAYTIESKVGKPVRVKWINDLKDANGDYLPHLLPVDQTLHWANPPGGTAGRDMKGMDQTPYGGPVPLVPHLHGSHVDPESDGYPEAWYLPAANNIPAGYATEGTLFSQIAGVPKQAGAAVYQYRNDQRAATLWYHDHTLGMTRVNVYAGPAGFYLLRGGASDLPNGILPSRPYEIPLLIQDRSFNADGSLFYPDNRAFFEGLNKFDPLNPVSPYLDIPFMPSPVLQPDGVTVLPSDVAPIWNPEFFGNTMVVNGKTWPHLNVEARRYRFRLLNGSDSRFLILTSDQAKPLTFWQVGADGGFLPAPAPLTQLLIGPAERADVVVDFSGYAPGTTITLLNVGPDEPFGGGVPCPPGQDPINNPGCGDFAAADPALTGKVMQFRVVARTSKDTTLNPAKLKLPAITPLGAATQTIRVSLNEEESNSVRVTFDGSGNLVLDQANGVPFGPTEAMLGSMDASGFPLPLEWMQAITENLALGATAVWEIYNFTADAHPIHIHQVQFEVVNREGLVLDPATGMPALPATLDGVIASPEVWETGTKDTVIVYPGSLTRVKAKFDIAGLYVWHCHILSHEDNEMMRPFQVGP